MMSEQCSSAVSLRMSRIAPFTNHCSLFFDEEKEKRTEVFIVKMKDHRLLTTSLIPAVVSGQWPVTDHRPLITAFGTVHCFSQRIREEKGKKLSTD